MKNKGFTLVEILVVMVIAAVLMGLSLVGFLGARKSARDGKRKADLEQIRTALEIYRNDCQTYPLTGTGIVTADLLKGTGIGNCAADYYMSQVPTDPLSPTYRYVYKKIDANHYALCSYLETGGSQITDGSCGSVNCGAACKYKVTNP